MNNSTTTIDNTLEQMLRRIFREEIAPLLSNGSAKAHDPDRTKNYLTIKDAADFSSLAPSTIRLLIRKRELRSLKVGSRVIIKREDLEKFLEANPICAVPE